MKKTLITFFLFIGVIAFVSCGDTSKNAILAPTNVEATAGEGLIEVTWKDNSNNETGFIIYREDRGAASLDTQAASQIGEVGEDVTSYKDEDVSEDRKYSYTVAAKGSNGSNSSQTAQEGPPVTPKSKLSTPKITSFKATPATGSVPLSVTFSWEISDPNGDTLTCTLDIDNDGKIDYTINNCSNNSTQVHTYNSASNYTAKLIVSDGKENAKEIANIRVESKSQEGILTADDHIDYDTTKPNDPYYIDYYDLTGLEGVLNSRAVDDEIALTLQSTFSSELIIYNKNKRLLSGGGKIRSSSSGILTFKVEAGVNYLVGVSSNGEPKTGLYTLSTNFGSLEPSDFGKLPPIVGSKDGKLTTDDFIDYDTTEDPSYPYYIDYYDLKDLDNNLSSKAVGKEVVLTLESKFANSSAKLYLYNKNKRQLIGTGGTIASSDVGLVSFIIDSSIDYLIGVSSYAWGDTGSYTLSTSLGSLLSSSEDGIKFLSQKGELTTNDLIDCAYASNHYVDYYNLTDLDNDLNSKVVDAKVVLTLKSDLPNSSARLFLYNKDKHKVISGDGTTISSGVNWLKFTVEPDINYLIGVSSYLEKNTISYTLSTSSGSLAPSDFGQPSDSKEGKLTIDDLIDPDSLYSYIDYYDLTGLDSNLNPKAIGDEVILTLKSDSDDFFYPSVHLSLYNKNERKLISGGGIIDSSDIGCLSFTVQSGIDYLIGISSYEVDSYTLSTTLGSLDPSDFGKPSDIEDGELTTDDLINYDNDFSRSYIDYYDLTGLDNVLSTKAVGDEVVLTLNSKSDTGFFGKLYLYNKDERQPIGKGGIITESDGNLLSFTIESGINYLVGVGSDFNDTNPYTLSTTLGSLNPSDFGFGVESEEGEITTDDLINYDYDPHYPYYIDYYDLKDLDSHLASKAVGDEVMLALRVKDDDFFYPQFQLSLYNKDERQPIGKGGVITESIEGFLTFTIESGIEYLIGVSSEYMGDTNSYTLSTSLGSLAPSDFGKNPFSDTESGGLATNDLTNPDTTYDKEYPFYIDYYELTNLGNNISTKAVGDKVILVLDSDFDYSGPMLFLYDKEKRNLSGGGEIDSSYNGILEFTVEPGVTYLIGVSSQYEMDTGSYKLSTTLGLLEPSNFGK